MTDKPIPLKDLASRINAHLKRMEADPDINPKEGNGARYYKAGACDAGRYVRVWYVRYQGEDTLERDEAAHYLEWLDAGNTGRHHQASEGVVFAKDRRRAEKLAARLAQYDEESRRRRLRQDALDAERRVVELAEAVFEQRASFDDLEAAVRAMKDRRAALSFSTS